MNPISERTLDLIAWLTERLGLLPDLSLGRTTSADDEPVVLDQLLYGCGD